MRSPRHPSSAWRRLGWAAMIVPLAAGCGDDETSATGTTGAGANGGGAGNAGGSGNQGATGAGASGGDATGGQAAGGEGIGGFGGQPAGYPDPPYGAEVGDTMPNLAWEGYVNDDAIGLASTEPFVDYSMNDVRLSGKAYALIHMAAVF